MRNGLLSRLKTFQFWVTLVLGALVVFYYVHLAGHKQERSATRELQAKYYPNPNPDDNHHQLNALRADYASLQRYHRSRHLNRLILSLNYWEQFTMATLNLMSLVCLGNWWNATTVQPFTYNSRLYGLRNFKPDDNFHHNRSAHPLDLIYDMNSLNNILMQRNFSPLAEFGNFLQYSSRNVVVVHYISMRETHELAVLKGGVGEKIEQDFKVNNIIDCREHLSGYLGMLEGAINSEVSASSATLQPYRAIDKFRVVKYWCVNMSVFSTPQESAEKMGFGLSEDVTIIVVNWRGLSNKPVIKGSVRGLHMNNRVAMFNTCKHRTLTNRKNLIAYSPFIIRTAQLYAASLKLEEDEIFAVVHLRSEKLGLREPRLPGVTLACFDELMRLTDNLAGKYPSMRFIYVTDYGPYSSDTCRKCRGSKDMKRFLHKRNISPVYFEPSHFNITNDTGVAAAVESQFMSSASFLFLCGGGGYQHQIASRFQLNRQSSMTDTRAKPKRIFRVCNDDNDIHTLLGNK